MSDISKALENYTSIFTPEYLEELEKKHYEEDRNYPENFSNWYPKILDFGKLNHVNIVSNQILTLEETNLFREEEYGKINREKLTEILKPTLDKMEPYQIYNLKNGCFSNKFDFDTSIVTKSTIVEKLWKITYQSLMYDTGGYTELVLRELIPNTIGTTHLTIYNGMPLRDEYRIFYNLDTEQVEYIVDYWDYNYCIEHLNTTDALVFECFHNKIKVPHKLESVTHNPLTEQKEQILTDLIKTVKFDKSLKGIWSVDILEEDGKYYLIDMARGYRSAYWNPKRCKGGVDSGSQNNNT